MAQATAALESAEEALRRLKEGPSPEDRLRAQQAVHAAQAQLTQAQNSGNSASVQAAQIELQLAQSRLIALDILDPEKVRAHEHAVEAARTNLLSALAHQQDVKAGARPSDLISAELAVLQAQRNLSASRERLAQLEARAGTLADADIWQLQLNLIELGYGGFEPSGVYDGETADAVRAWQRDLGMPVTGRIEPGQVVFLPGAARVVEQVSRVGDSVGQAPVLRVTATTPIVSVALDPALQSNVKVGDAVTVRLPDRRTTPGVISSVGTVAASGQGANSRPTITVLVELTEAADASRLDQAPVSVSITTATADNALVVPITALVAMSGGGHAVEVALADGTRQLIPVRTGIFDSSRGLVAVTGEGLAARQQVVVPGR